MRYGYMSAFQPVLAMEALYHCLWKYRMIGRRLATADGHPVTVLSPGIHNHDAGPDFSNARIRIDDTEWAGNVEIHVRASDWLRHGHDRNPAYDNVALHVVGVDDMRIRRRDGSVIPQVVITLPQDTYSLYALLSEGMESVRCARSLPQIPEINRIDWIESMGIARLHEKAGRIRQLLDSLGGDWQQALFITLARALGFGLNSVPFELTAKSLPLNYLSRHSDNPQQLEALLFGQAGMLDPALPADDYYAMLCREYSFLARKYSLHPIGRELWKYARTRPANFPHRRIAILAGMLIDGFHLRDSLAEAKGDIDALRECFRSQASPYWQNHSTFGVSSSSSLSRTLSASAIDLLLINVAAPFYFAYGASKANPDLAQAGCDLLRQLKSERNSIISHWEAIGIKVKSAFESQALLHLRNEYCERARCLECRFGVKLLADRLR